VMVLLAISIVLPKLEMPPPAYLAELPLMSGSVPVHKNASQ